MVDFGYPVDECRWMEGSNESTVIIYDYDSGYDYGESLHTVFFQDGKFWESQDSCCSCYSTEWNPSEISIEQVISQYPDHESKIYQLVSEYNRAHG